MNLLNEAKQVFDIEIQALEKTKENLKEDFVEIVDLIVNCDGKVILTGMGKSGHIAKKIAATMASLGTSAFYLHPGEALHGDLGMISEQDVVIAISYSGESEEIIKILPNIRLIGAKIIAISGNKDSTLIKLSDISQVFPDFKEACFLNLAPTSSTTATLVYGDALAVAASARYGFTEKDFGLYHPAGALGKKLILKVDHIMAIDQMNPVINEQDLLTDAIVEMSKKGLGVVFVKDKENKLKGIITDGDLRRLIEKKIDFYNAVVSNVMKGDPVSVVEKTMAVNALKLMKDKKINCLPVINKKGEMIGTLTLQMMLKAGLVL